MKKRNKKSRKDKNFNPGKNNTTGSACHGETFLTLMTPFPQELINLCLYTYFSENFQLSQSNSFYRAGPNLVTLYFFQLKEREGCNSLSWICFSILILK